MSTLTPQSYSLFSISQVSRPCDDLDGVRSHVPSVGGFEKTIERRKKFVGVRKRPSGRWVAEIKDTAKKIRLWLGTFQTAEEAAMAYDEAARLLRGFNTRTNFAANLPKNDSPVASRIRKLLSLHKDSSSSSASKPNKKKIKQQSQSNSSPTDEEIQGPTEDLEPKLRSESYSYYSAPVNDLKQSGNSLLDEENLAVVRNGSTSFLQSPNFDLGSSGVQLPSTNEILVAAIDDHLGGRCESYVDAETGFRRMSFDRRISAYNGFQGQFMQNSGHLDSFNGLVGSSSAVPWSNYGAWNVKESSSFSYTESLDIPGVFEALWDVSAICKT